MGYKARNLFYRRGRLPGEGIVLQQMFFMSMQDKASSSVSNGRWESSLSASAEAKPSEKQKKQGSSFSLAIHRKCITCGKFHLLQEVGPRRGPGGERKAPWSPPQRRNPLRSRKSKIGSFPCHPQGICFLWEVSSACGRTRYFPTRESTQRVPGAAKGCMSHGRPRTPRC